jgi:hypothetical protein
MSGERLRELGASYLRAIRSIAPTFERVTDKMPGNFAHAGLIHLALPHARIIHTRREPRRPASRSCSQTARNTPMISPS